MVIEKEKLLGGNCILILIYYLNDKFVTQKQQDFYTIQTVVFDGGIY
jgi:hypothetical protein